MAPPNHSRRGGRPAAPASASSSFSAQALTETGRTLTGRYGVGLLEDLAASQLPQALADLARLHPGATLEVLSEGGFTVVFEDPHLVQDCDGVADRQAQGPQQGEDLRVPDDVALDVIR
ncbi:hypothetical protein ACIQFZ_42620 [Streptomyces sp. NPDC093064]|uniref:hypothetical protein n=1 Tax=Streptomyces sp. NPDC093064 TaxID=3366020 RepID=UPI0038150FB3